MRSPKSNLAPLVVVLAVLLPVVFGVGLIVGGRVDLPGFLGGGDDGSKVVVSAIDQVRDTYYRKIPTADLNDAALKGVVKSLDDRFSNYFTPKEYAAFQMSQDSQFSGIGTTVAPDPLGLRIVQVYDESPAARAGVKPGDVLTAADGKSLKGLPQETAVARVKGPMGTDVRLAITRGGKKITTTVTRATVSVPQVASRIETYKGKKYGYVALGQFGGGAHAEVYAAIAKVRKAGAKGLVFDLRGNGGGLVSEAQLVASGFLKDGDIVTTRGRNVPSRTLKATGDPVAADLPLVVLVDGNSASASEIVTGALQDRHRALVVGTKTFGKGVFQEIIKLSNGGALDITAGQYFTPSGRNLGGRRVEQGAGITPDVKAKDDPKTRKVDEGLQGALKALSTEPAPA